MSSSEGGGGISTIANAGTPEAAAAPRKKQRRGFAAMDASKQKEIASKGGKASHAHGTGHEWNASSAREAGRKGGLASHGGRGKHAGKP
ncbi:MAG: Stress-induced bacterial acidophilic repeat motif [Myxococcaceae bacterium]|nr:Stress-induced bacterial acidophilic repeat motif [Myxococcaceae bacterium]